MIAYPTPLKRMSRLPRALLLALTCVFLAMSLRSVQAQSLRIGVQAGPTFGFLSNSATPFSAGTPRTNANPRLNLQAGMHLIVPLSKHLALQPELRVLRKGGHFSQPLSERYTVERYRFSYLQGALLLRRSLSLSGPLSLHLAAGLSIDRTLNGETQRNLHSAERDFAAHVTLQESGRLRAWDVGGVLEGGLEYSAGPAGRIGLTLRYNPGFRSVFVRPDRGARNEQATDTPFPLPQTVTALRHDVTTAGLSYTISL